MTAPCRGWRLLSAGGVAIGEIGLDPSYAVSMECQERAFRDQLRLAVSLGLPVLIHCRRAFQQTLQILQEEGARHVGGIMHAFSGSPEMAREFIRLGFAISISGMVTRDNSVRLPRLVSELPLEASGAGNRCARHDTAALPRPVESAGLSRGDASCRGADQRG